MSKDYTIAKNAGSLAVGQVVTGALSLLYIVIVPRHLGPVQVGQWALALALTSLISIFCSLGMETLLVKELARNPQRAGKSVGAALVTRLLLSVPGLGVVVLFVTLAHYPARLQVVFYLVGLQMVIMLFSTAIRPAFRAFEKMHYDASADMLQALLTTGLGIAAVELGFGLLGVVIVTLVVSVLVLAAQWRLVTRIAPIQFSRDPVLMKWLVVSSLPFWATNVFLTIYVYIDSFMLGVMTTVQVVGWYNPPTQLFSTLLFVPVILTTAVFPALARSFQGDSVRLEALSRRIFHILLTLGMPIGFGLTVLAGPLIALLYGPAFQPSAPVLAILGLCLIPTYVNIFANQLLIAVDKQIHWTKVMGAATVINPLLNLGLIRVTQSTYGNGAIGAAMSLLITEALMAAAALWLLPRGLLGRHTIITASKALGCGAVMVLAIWFVRHAFIGIPIGVGAFTYLICGLALRLWPSQELQEIKSIAQVILRKVGLKSAPVPEVQA